MKKKFLLGINTGCVSGELPFDRLVDAIRNAGFDACFTMWDPDPAVMDSFGREIRRAGLIYQSVHAPYHDGRYIWEDAGAAGERAMEKLYRCLEDCVRVEIPVMVVHPMTALDCGEPTQLGLDRFRGLVQAAEKTSVKIAFENLDGEQFLHALMAEFGQSPAVGFCLDTGHEVCYNGGKDLLALYGRKLIATHLNDNRGYTGVNGEAVRADDLHFLPFDGALNWQGVMDRIHKCGYEGILTFELLRHCKHLPETQQMPAAALGAEDYLRESYARAVQVAEL